MGINTVGWITVYYLKEGRESEHGGYVMMKKVGMVIVVGIGDGIRKGRGGGNNWRLDRSEAQYRHV